jgi:hypothetical protein
MNENKPLLIICNGPSAKKIDWNWLKEKQAAGLVDTFAMNASYKKYEELDFYPTYYSCIDDVVVNSHLDKIKKLADSQKIEKFFLLKTREVDDAFKNDKYKKFVKIINRINIWFNLQSCVLGNDYDNFTSWKNTGTDTLQIALMLGYRNIYIIGADGNYQEQIQESEVINNPNGKNQILEITETPKDNPNYWFSTYQEKGDRYNFPNGTRCHQEPWNKASLFCKKIGIKLTNLSDNKEYIENINLAEYDDFVKNVNNFKITEMPNIVTIITPLLKMDDNITQTADSLMPMLVRGTVKWLIKYSGENIPRELQYLRPKRNIKIILQKDNSLYDGLNQALNLVDTKYFMVLGAGDRLTHNAEQLIKKNLYENENNLDGIFFSVLNTSTNYVSHPDFKRLNEHMSLHHQGAILNTEKCKNIGGFDSTYKLAGDYDLVGRFFKKFKNLASIDEVVCFYMGKGLSDVRALEYWLETYVVRSRIFNDDNHELCESILKNMKIREKLLLEKKNKSN